MCASSFCALVFKNSSVFFVLGVPWFVVFSCFRICVSFFLQFGLQNCWPSGVSTFQLCSQLCFFGLPALLFCTSTSSCSAFQREGEGEGERERGHRRRQKERGRGQTREIGEIGRGRETERGEGQGRDKEGREREIVKGLTSTTGFHSLETGGLDLTN